MESDPLKIGRFMKGIPRLRVLDDSDALLGMTEKRPIGIGSRNAEWGGLNASWPHRLIAQATAGAGRIIWTSPERSQSLEPRPRP